MRLDTILDSIDSGAIALPEFQRGYVWSRGQVRGLMDSLYRAHPVGSLLTWQTRTEGATARGDTALQPGTVQLLLDGQQRITTLYGIVRGQPPAFFDGNAQAFADLRFHLDEETFEFWQPVKMRDDPLWIDVSQLMSDGPAALMGQLWSSAGGDADAQALAQARADRVNRIHQIRQRDFHIELVTGEDKTVDVVVDIFNRVNSGGTKLSKGDLALAKVCAEWPQARAELKQRLARWSAAGFDFSLELLLRTITAIVTGRAMFAALADVSTDDFRDGLARAERAIDKLLNTLASRLGLDHGTVLPATYPLVPMARYLADRDFAFSDHRERDRLLYWYLHAAMWGRYAGSTETVLQQDLAATASNPGDPIERLLANLRQQRGDLTVHPGDFHAWSRGARFYPILYLLTRVHGARDLGTGEQLDRHALGRHTDLEIHHVFPKAVLYARGHPRAEVNALANFTFLALETNRKISDTPPADYLPRCIERYPGAVESHWMPMEPGLWDVERYPEFLERRRILLAAATNELLDRLLKGLPEETAEAEPVALAAVAEPPVGADEEELQLAELQRWMVERGFDAGVLEHELVTPDGSQEAILDLAWPRGLQPGLSEPVALLIDEPVAVFHAASRHGYRPFADAESVKAYARDLELLTDRDADAAA
jgi:hypothetical protein